MQTLYLNNTVIRICCGRHVNGYPDRPPVRPNISLGDTLAGMHAVLGTTMALLERTRKAGKVRLGWG